jgi:hypothetical protein
MAALAIAVGVLDIEEFCDNRELNFREQNNSKFKWGSPMHYEKM